MITPESNAEVATATPETVTTTPTAVAETNEANTATAVLEKPAKAKKPAKKPAKEPKAKKSDKLTDDELKTEEDTLRKKYKDQDIVKGSIANIGAATALNGETIPKKYREWNKRTVVIKCQWDKCKEVRRIATSDLAQVKYCELHTQEARKARRKELRKKKPKAKAKAK